MGRRSKLILASLLTTLCLAVVVSDASAHRFEIHEQNFFMTWPAAEQLRFINNEYIAIECEVLLGGIFHSRIFSKVSGSLIGEIHVTQKEPCTTRPGERFGLMWILDQVERQEGVELPESLPWHIRYDSFTGTLPAIVTMKWQLIGASFLLQGVFGIRCLFKSTAERPLFLIAELKANGEIERVRVDETKPIPKKPEFELCPATVTLRGRALIYNTTMGGENLTVRLVA